MVGGILARAVAAAVTIVPALGKVRFGLSDECSLKRLGELDEHAVLVHMEPARQLDRSAGVANALETAIVGGISAPTRHATDVKLPILGVEASAVDAGA